jgi:integrase
MARLREQPETIARLALQFTVLTAARSKETRFAKWSEIDLDARDWNRPAEHMKRRIPHTVSLSDAALAVLEQAARYRTTKADCLIFPGKSGKPLSDMTMAKALRTSGETVTVHGFRSTFKDWASEQMGHIPDAVSEAALSHAVPDAVIAAYRRTPFNAMRRQLLDAWASYVSGGGKVVRLSVA